MSGAQRRLERRIRQRERKRLADLNRNGPDIFRGMLRVTLFALAVIISILVWFWAAEKQAQEVQAAVLRAHRITDGPLYGPGEIPIVEPLPAEPPTDGAPPEAIEISTQAKASNVLEEDETHWESLGRWKLTAYCPGSCCNGKGRAWKTASGKPMEIGRTVAVGGLPFGTILMINGHEYEVTDRGVHGHHVDILHESHSAARKFGVQYAEVFIKR